MPVHVCPRCQRTNPPSAVYCYNDGALLQGGGNGAATATGALAREFVFPSGRRCKTIDDFAAGCQEEWAQARELLRQGAFKQFFGNLGRADLVRAVQEAMAQPDGDVALNALLGVLPASRTFQPKLDIHPRKVDLGKIMIGDSRRLQFALGNPGQGQLQGTLKISEGGDWLTLAGGALSCPVSIPTKREQKIIVEISTMTLVALQTYGGVLTVVTNGGVVEVPVRLELAARPFGKPPFPHVKTPREMAEHMRNQSKAAVPLLESGEVFRWFASNNWNYPVLGQPIKGVAGVQQFFEAMGLSKPPALQLSQTEVRFRCDGPDPVRFQVVLSTPARKWVYAVVEADKPWLKVLTPQVSGPQRATIAFEVEARSILNAPISEAKLAIMANAGQKQTVKVVVESTHPSAALAATSIAPGRAPKNVPRAPAPAPEIITVTTIYPAPRPAAGGKPTLLGAVLAMATAMLLLRLCLAPMADFWACADSVRSAAVSLNQKIGDHSPLHRLGGWLRLPWSRVLFGVGSLSPSFFDDNSQSDLEMGEFRYHFVKHLARDFVFALWWVGPLAAVIMVRLRGGGWSDLPWALLAGTVAGIVAGASLACAFLTIEAVPHALFDLILGGRGDLVMLFLWLLLSLLTWTGMGALAGLWLGMVGPLRQAIVVPVQRLLEWLAGLVWLGKVVRFNTGNG